MIITKKKIVLMVLIGIGLIAGLIIVLFPTWFGLGAAQDPSTVPVPTAMFLYAIPTTLVFWNGIYAGHNFAHRAGWDGVGSVGFRLVLFFIAWYIGFLLSLPISLYEIFFKNDY